MRRVAALYDIHGNLPALEAVLREIDREAVDGVIVGGDVFPGPMSAEVFARLRGLDRPVQFISGNCERSVLDARAGREDARLPEQVRETIRWSAEQLSAEEERTVAAWPLTLCVAIEGIGDVLFCHATPRDDNELFTRLTDEARVARAFAGVDVPLVVCGHTHMPFDRHVGSIRVVNAGSVGMPFGDPGADWLLLGPGVELRHTNYDLAAAAERIRRTAYPQAEEFAAREVLRPRSAEEMLELYGRYELS